MENLITRYRNVTILVAVLFAQVFGLAVQVKRNTENESSRLIRVWTVSAVTPLEKGIVWFQSGLGNLWHSYIYLRGVRQENRDLKAEIGRLRLEQVRLSGDAEQAKRLQALLGFKEQFISKTVAAQVIGSSGSEQSRSIYIDKGTSNGIDKGMAVMTADGIVGKVLRADISSALVLLINDQSSGVGAILEKTRLQGIVKGTPAGEVVLEKVMSDEQVPAGERVLTSGGDQIFPKGLPIGTVKKTTTGPEMFLNIRVRPAADLSKLEEVLVITRQEERTPSVAETGRVRAVDILAQRLPSVPDKPADGSANPGSSAVAPAPGQGTGTKPPATAAIGKKPEGNAGEPSAGGSRPAPEPQTAAEGKPNTGTPAVPKPGNAVVKPASAQKPVLKVTGQTMKPSATAPKLNPAQKPPEASAPEDKPQ